MQERPSQKIVALCPSAQPVDAGGSPLIGVVGGSAKEPRVSALRRPLQVVTVVEN
jgi:hypothetical protein